MVMLDNQVAHNVIEVLQQILRIEGKLWFCNGFNGIGGEQQVQERHDQSKWEQREKYGDEIEYDIQNHGTPIGLDVGEDSGEFSLAHGFEDINSFMIWIREVETLSLYFPL